MPTENRVTAGRTDRCSEHPGTQSVASCDGCGRALCIACATPVRGLVYGAECLPADVADARTESPAPRPPSDPALRLAGIALGVATLATFLPWTRFGRGSGIFGAWNPTWAGVAAIAFALGALVWVVDRSRPGRIASARIAEALLVLAATGVAASVLALVRPPAFARPWLGHLVALAAGVIALGAAIAARRRAGAPRRPRLG
ncbi:MAG: hypothetical protein WD206_00785 [Actinomycetota bacterium]